MLFATTYLSRFHQPGSSVSFVDSRAPRSVTLALSPLLEHGRIRAFSSPLAMSQVGPNPPGTPSPGGVCQERRSANQSEPCSFWVNKPPG